MNNCTCKTIQGRYCCQTIKFRNSGTHDLFLIGRRRFQLGPYDRSGEAPLRTVKSSSLAWSCLVPWREWSSYSSIYLRGRLIFDILVRARWSLTVERARSNMSIRTTITQTTSQSYKVAPIRQAGGSVWGILLRSRGIATPPAIRAINHCPGGLWRFELNHTHTHTHTQMEVRWSTLAVVAAAAVAMVAGRSEGKKCGHWARKILGRKPAHTAMAFIRTTSCT